MKICFQRIHEKKRSPMSAVFKDDKDEEKVGTMMEWRPITTRLMKRIGKCGANEQILEQIFWASGRFWGRLSGPGIFLEPISGRSPGLGNEAQF